MRARDVHLYRLCEDLTEALIYLMVVFSPWAFGTTEAWSIWTMNAGGYALGLLLGLKLIIRRLKGYWPPRWEAKVTSPTSDVRSLSGDGWTTRILVGLTFAILGYCLVGALNARATYRPAELRFEYHGCIEWLPHSLESGRTWFAFWSYLALACSFWGVRDWLLGKTSNEERAEYLRGDGSGISSAPLLPARFRRLLWVLAINGALLGLEAIVQRLEGSGRLLFLVKPHVNPSADSQFGPFAYRGTAASYFNLLWPVCLGFWWTLHRSGGLKGATHHLLLLCGLITAACPVISLSRGGALVTAAMLALGTVFLLAAYFPYGGHRRQKRTKRNVTLAAVGLFALGVLAAGYGLGWKALKPRMAQLASGFQEREEMFERARPMARDYPLYGTGPGTFEPVFQLYRLSSDTYWPAQLHNDWLETRITFGWFGSGLLAMAFLAVVLHWFERGGVYGGRRFVGLIWLALAGSMAHARFDFPFQIYSIVFLVLALCALLVNLSRRR